MKKGTKKMKNDRNYYRQFNHRELMETVKLGINVNWKEMSIVLLERLEYEINLPRESDSDYY